MESLIYLLVSTSFIGLLFGFRNSFLVEKEEKGTDKMNLIADRISKSVFVFFRTNLRAIAIFAGASAILLFVGAHNSEVNNFWIAGSFVLGAGFSVLSNYLALLLSTRSNVKTANAARSSSGSAFKNASNSATAIGIVSVSLMLLGISGVFLLHTKFAGDSDINSTIKVISGFILGTSTILFITASWGGIFSKSADLGADMSEYKNEGISSNVSFNPATNTDNAGDHINNVAGSSSNITDSLSITVIAAMLLGSIFLKVDNFSAGLKQGIVLLPAALAGASILISILASFTLHVKDGINTRKAISIGEIVVFISTVISSYFIIDFLLPSEWITVTETSESTIETTYTSIGVFWALLTGIISCALLTAFTEFFTGIGSRSVSEQTTASLDGESASILSGFEKGWRSTIFPGMIFIFMILISYRVAGFYGISIATLGLLSMAAYRISIDSFGAISESAADIAYMSQLADDSVANTNRLEQSGNNTFAIVKMFSIFGALLSSVSIVAATTQLVNLNSLDILAPVNLSILLFGALIPVAVSSSITDSIIKTSRVVIDEIKRQIVRNPELSAASEIVEKYHGDIDQASEEELIVLEAAEKNADFESCTEKATISSLKESVYPILIAIVFPIAAGIIGGVEAVSALVLGALASGFVLSISQVFSGFTWSNSKKMIQKGITIDDSFYSKSSELYKTASVGDSLGDPLKDAVSVGISSTIKFMAVVSFIVIILISAVG